MSSFCHTVLVLFSGFIYLWNMVLGTKSLMLEKNYLVKNPHSLNAIKAFIE